jgi:hypothetical protein
MIQHRKTPMSDVRQTEVLLNAAANRPASRFPQYFDTAEALAI